eukprot:COSAG06_NODE_3805_length_4889_cov_10.869520_3_plen_173_part_00
MKTRDGRNIVMPKPPSGDWHSTPTAGSETERQRAETVRQRQAVAHQRRPTAHHGGGGPGGSSESSEDALTATIRAALRRDPALGLKKLTKIVQEEGGHPNASTRDVRTALAALEASAPPVESEQDAFERMMQRRREETVMRKRESRQAVCIMMAGMCFLLGGVWIFFQTFDT